MRSDVLIVGAGPTGLVLALWLTKLGVSVRLIDKTAEAGTTSRALAVQARTLELYRQLDLDGEVVRRGHKTPAVNLWARGRQVTRLPFEDIGKDLTPFSFMLVFPQDQHEKLLVEKLESLGGTVERSTELLGFEEAGGHVRARVRRPDGAEETCEAIYIIGCDGARSVVRETLKTGFPGGTYRQIFYVADIEGAGPPVNGDLHVDLDEADFLAVFPLAGEGRARLVGTVRGERADHPENLKFEDVSGRAIENMKIEVLKVNWFSTYHVHHRVTESFRTGRAFLVGDSAHIHSPAGGQGMNTGIGDAINLAWKLAAVLAKAAPEALLDSYEAERIGFARRLVATTDRAFTFATADGPLADILRTRVAPFVMSRAVSIDAVREFMFRTVGQVTLNYRGGPLSAGKAGHVQGGDRLPWVSASGEDNFEPLTAMTWQVHVYGGASADLAAWCAAHDVPLNVFAWREAHGRAGLARNAVYLLRPDTYVALAEPSGSAQALERYFAERGLRFTNQATTPSSSS
jgi:2-polyprenyl-6-methoxyphenol hydroxylase-like FAD-dependent oxidoreductase